MKGSRIIRILKTFSKDELKSFGNYINSPFFNSRPVQVKLFKALKTHYPSFSEKHIDKIKIFKFIHNGKKFNEQIFKNDSSEFLRHLKNFLIHSSLDQDPDTRWKIILSELNSRRLNSLFSSEVSRYSAFLHAKSNIDELFFDKLFQIENSIVQHGLFQNEQKKITKNVVTRTSNQIFNLYIWLLKSLCEIRNNEFIFNAVYEPNLPHEFFEHIKNFDILKHSNMLPGSEKEIFEIFYFGVLATYFDDNNEYYYRCKKLIIDNIDKFRFEVSYNFLVRLETSCIHKSRKYPEFSRELFEVYNMKLKHRLYKYSTASEFSIINFRNMLVVALGLGEISWTENFIKEYYSELPAEHREWMYNFAWAKLSFEKKDFNETMQYLERIEKKEFAFIFDIRSLRIKLFYEMGNIDSLLHEMETYRQFLYKNRNVSESRRTGYLNFISLLNEILKIPGDKEIEDLLYRAENTNPLNDKDWLLKKIKSVKRR